MTRRFCSAFSLIPTSRVSCRGAFITLPAGEPIGTVGLPRIDRAARQSSIAYELVRDYWGRGFAREAVLAAIDFGFHTLRLTKLQAEIDSLNTRSVRFIEKLGFTHEQTIEEVIDDDSRTTFRYALTDR